MKTDEFDKRFAPFLERLHALINTPLLEDPPDELFHYTSVNGLYGIIESNVLRASNLRFMNDFSELTYAHDLILQVLEETFLHEGDAALIEYREQAEKIFDPFHTDVDAYAFCLCKSGDQLSQWREYGEKGNGYAIGFSKELLQSALTGNSQQIRVTRVIYDSEEQRQLVRSVVELIREAIPSSWTTPEATAENWEAIKRHFLGVLAMAMAPLVYSFKDPAFRDEREWRLIDWRKKNDTGDVKFIVLRGNLIPYIDLILPMTDGPRKGRLPISTVIQGPHVAPEIGEKALKLLLAKHGYSETQARRSVVPIRF